MENKIAIASLASLLAQSTGKSKKLCEDFLREFFRLTAETLEKGETLKIKGFGTFKVTSVDGRSSVNVNTGEPYEIAPHKKVVFTPTKELASAINAPFEDFESVEMEDDMPEEFFIQEEPETIIEGSEKSEIIEGQPEMIVVPKVEKLSDENTVDTERLEEGSNEEGEDDELTYEAYTAADAPPSENVPPSSPVYPQQIDNNMPEEESSEYEYPAPAKSRFGIGFLVGALSTFAVCAVIFMLGCFFDWWPVNFGNPKDVTAEVVQSEKEVPNPDSNPQEVITPEKEPVYDTVSTTRYLTTIAREHYGNYNFWPYIYLENESILGHPDRITPGTKVVVPDLSKYGVDPANK